MPGWRRRRVRRGPRGPAPGPGEPGEGQQRRGRGERERGGSGRAVRLRQELPHQPAHLHGLGVRLWAPGSPGASKRLHQPHQPARNGGSGRGPGQAGEAGLPGRVARLGRVREPFPSLCRRLVMLSCSPQNGLSASDSGRSSSGKSSSSYQRLSHLSDAPAPLRPSPSSDDIIQDLEDRLWEKEQEVRGHSEMSDLQLNCTLWAFC